MQSIKKKVLVFGGAFNPPTLSHQEIIGMSLKIPYIKEVWVMPSGNRQDKKLSITNYHRIQMLEIIKKYVFSNTSKLVISNFELNLPTPTSTYTTSQKLKKLYKNLDFYFAFGSDSYNSMSMWKRGNYLKNNLKLIIFNRSNDKIKPGNNVITVLNQKLKNICSSDVRKLISEGRDISYATSRHIQKYIKENKLYIN